MRLSDSRRARQEELEQKPWEAYLSGDLWEHPAMPSTREKAWDLLTRFQQKGMPADVGSTLETQWTQYYDRNEQSTEAPAKVSPEQLEAMVKEDEQMSCLHPHAEELWAPAWSYAGGRWRLSSGVYSCDDCSYVGKEPIGKFKDKSKPSFPNLDKIIY